KRTSAHDWRKRDSHFVRFQRNAHRQTLIMITQAERFIIYSSSFAYAVCHLDYFEGCVGARSSRIKTYLIAPKPKQIGNTIAGYISRPVDAPRTRIECDRDWGNISCGWIPSLIFQTIFGSATMPCYNNTSITV